MAMQDAGLLQKGQDPDSNDFADNMQRLNDLINLWQTQGLKLWLQEELEVILTSGVRQYTLGPAGTIPMVKPTRVLSSAFYADVSGNRRPLNQISRAEWMQLSTLSTLGPINSYFVDKQQDQIAVNLWLTPDDVTATGRVVLLIQNQVPNMVSLNDQMSFPQEWFIALRWGLADDIATGQPMSIVQRCAGKATAYRTALEDWDVEDASTSFAPDTQTGYGYNSSFS